MASALLPDIAAERTDLSAQDIAHLQSLQADWTLIADLSFADLLLWLRGRHYELDRAFATATVIEGLPKPDHSVTRAIPVRRDGRTIALLGLYANAAGEARLEQVYIDCAKDLCAMVATGEFPRETQSDQGHLEFGGSWPDSSDIRNSCGSVNSHDSLDSACWTCEAHFNSGA